MLCQQWSGIFRARSTDIPNDQAEMMFAFVQPVPSDLNWINWLDEFLRSFLPPNVNLLLARMVCRLVCTALQEVLGPCFFAAYQAILQGSALPAAFGASRTVFIPKSSAVDAQGLIVRSPESLRPLTLCTCALQGSYRCHVFGFTKMLHRVRSPVA